MEKIIKTNRARLFIVSFFIFVLFAVIGYFYVNDTYFKNKVSLYFTDINNRVLFLEQRAFTNSDNKSKDILSVLKELAYGPLNYNLEPVLSHGAEIINVWVSGNFVYINLSPESFKSNDKYNLGLRALNKTLFSNFPGIKRVKYLISGSSLPTVKGFNNLGIFYSNTLKIK